MSERRPSPVVPARDAASMLIRDAERQEQLLIVTADLVRLQALLDTSHADLQRGFFDAHAALGAAAGSIDDGATTSAHRVACTHLEGAMKALQFHDLATQLLAHTTRRLRRSCDRMACDVFADDGDDDSLPDDASSSGPNPVTQSAMDAGAITLF